MKTFRWTVALAAMLAGSGALAAEGAFEINQACVAAGCFPGDAPGFPVTLSTPGMYSMTSSLTVPDTATQAIVVAASDVTIEMQGFRIVGPITCSGTPTVCSPAINGGGAAGIDAWSNNPSNVTVRNGSITGMGSGLLVSYDGRAEKIKALQNGYIGIRARTGAAVVDSAGTANGKVGIEGALIEDCVVTRNPQYGLAVAGNAAVVRNVVVEGNTGYGIYLNSGATLIGIAVSANDVGIIANGGAQILDSVFKGNTGVAITNTQGTLAVARSTFLGNNGGGQQWGGTIVQLAPNLCGTSTTCP